MTQATDTDIREIRTALDSIAKVTEVNAKAIADLTQEMRDGFSNIRTDIKTLDTRTTDLREEMRVGFADIRSEIKEVRGEIKQVETKLDGEIKEVKGLINTSEAKLVGKIDKLDERTRLGFWGFVGRGLVLAILIALIPFVTRYAALFLPEILKP